VEYADFTILPDIPQINQPAPKLLDDNHCVEYPPANQHIVNNIAAELLRNNNFYHKVLQLMKNINLPPPFLQMPKDSVVTIEPSDIEEVEMEELYKEDTEESELETDSTILGEKEVIPDVAVRHKKLKQLKRPKKLKLLINQSTVIPVKVKPSSSAVQTISEIFEHKDISSAKKLEFKISSEILNANSDQLIEVQEGKTESFGTFAPPPPSQSEQQSEVPENQEEGYEFISKRKLQISKLQEEGKK
jgi:hypothetical protein